LRIEIRAIGRVKSGPEREMTDDYLRRAEGQGRALGLPAFTEREIDGRGLSGKAAETAALIGDLPPGAAVIALDERGKAMTSRQFADMIARQRDEGARDMVFLIGGADGMDRAALPQGTRLLSFGTMVWPHKLVRVMLAEQLYRAVSLMAGAPYHRD
jgi:23S rRNA (pseudouridine1915-N3)-methyltransferase